MRFSASICRTLDYFVSSSPAVGPITVDISEMPYTLGKAVPAHVPLKYRGNLSHTHARLPPT